MVRTMASKRANRRTFLGLSAASLLLAACGSGAAPTAKPADTAAKPADTAAKPAAGSTSAPAASQPVQAAAKGVVLEMSFPDWIIDVNPAVQKLSDEYSQTFGVKINVSKQPPDTEQKMQLEANAKRSTWHGVEGYAGWANMATMVELDALAPWENLITKEDYEDLLPTARQEMTYKGKQYLFPYRVSPNGIGWRPNINKEVGLPNTPPATWDEFVARAQTFQEKKSTPDRKFFGNATTLEPRYTFYSIVQALAKDPYDYDKGLFNVDLPEIPQALELLKKISTFSPPEALRGDTLTVASTGQCGQICGHLLTMFRAKKPLNGDMQTVAFPKITYNRTNYWSSGPYIMKYGNQIEESAKYWLWLSKQKRLYDDMWVVNGSPPNRKSVFKEFEPQKGKELDAGIWDTIVQQEAAPPMPNSLWFPLQHTIVRKVLEDYVAGKIATPKDAIGAMKKQTDDEIAKQKK
jgi:ABC-type glycerol-3-phosphate transport system substrate-binding protein